MLGTALGVYRIGTPGTQLLDNATAILGAGAEPQPDLCLRILTEYGGRSRENARRYLEGPPELIAEVAHSRESIDLGQKREDYEQAGVLEYLVVCIAEDQLHWLDFRTGGAITANRQGIFRSRVFPGLWLDGAAVLTADGGRLVEVIQEGLASKAHAAFGRRLAAARRRHSAADEGM
jgi:Uma2 family endonuclease